MVTSVKLVYSPLDAHSQLWRLGGCYQWRALPKAFCFSHAPCMLAVYLGEVVAWWPCPWALVLDVPDWLLDLIARCHCWLLACGVVAVGHLGELCCGRVGGA